MKIPNFVYRLFGKFIAKKLDLKDGPMEDKKKWYKSKAVIAGFVTVLITLYTGIDAQIAPLMGFDLPDIPVFVYTILGAMGVYGRVVAKTKIG